MSTRAGNDLADDLPVFDRYDLLIAQLFEALERIEPGTIERAMRRVDSDAHRSAVIRLRGPRMEPAVNRAFTEAQRVMGVISAVNAPVLRIKRKRRKD